METRMRFRAHLLYGVLLTAPLVACGGEASSSNGDAVTGGSGGSMDGTGGNDNMGGDASGGQATGGNDNMGGEGGSGPNCQSGYELDDDGVTCVDIDECATNNGDCGSSTYYSCTNNDAAAPTCADIDECAVDNGNCGDPAYVTCLNKVGAPPQCGDIDECAENNGDCGDATYVTCVDQAAGNPQCVDIDECADNNGGCGDEAYVTCVDQAADEPLCVDIDECAVNNGGCGDEAHYSCTNNEGADPTCGDVDECETNNGGCEQLCVNEEGSSSCACKGGYALTDNGTSCVALPEAGYELVYSYELPTNADFDTLASLASVTRVDNASAFAGIPFSRLAYRLVLDDKWAWTSMNDFTNGDVGSAGIPVDKIFDQSVSGLNVFTNAGAGSQGVSTGKLEFWSDCYSEGAGGIYDTDDEYAGWGTDCYGSMQVHEGTSVVWAYNAWSSGNTDDLGIGNNTSGHPDWTFKATSVGYSKRLLEVYVLPADDVGCADGTREAFTDQETNPNIAGCDGAWTTPGVLTVAPASCGHHGGDDGSNPAGTGCGVADLCAVGWHVCTGGADVTTSSPSGCDNLAADASAFYATRQSGPGNHMCGSGANDLFGCGSGYMPTSGCGSLTTGSSDLCQYLNPAWQCGGNGYDEANAVTKTSSAGGGVLCCRD